MQVNLQVKKHNTNHYFILLAAAVIFIYVLVCFVQPNFQNIKSDDGAYYAEAHAATLPDYLTKQYNNWGGRLFAYIMLYMMEHAGVWLYRLLTPLFMLLASYSVTRIFFEDVNIKFMLLSFLSFGIIQQFILSSSIFWFTGSCFYLMPVSFGFFALIPYADSYFRNKKNISAARMALLLPAAIFSSLANEQMTLLLACIVIVFHVQRLISKEKISISFYILSAVFILCSLCMFLSPGEKLRAAVELQWFPGFDKLSFAQHVRVGACWFFNSVVNTMFLLVFALSFLPIFFRNSYKGGFKYAYYIFALMFFVVIASKIYNVGFQPVSKTGNPLFDFGFLFNNPQAIWADIFLNKSLKDVLLGILPYVFWTAYFVLLVVLISAQDEKHSLFVSLCFLGAFAKLLLMFFSPTIFASGNRTLFICAMILAAIFSYSIKKSFLFEQKLTFVFLAVLFAVNFSLLFAPWILGHYYIIY